MRKPLLLLLLLVVLPLVCRAQQIPQALVYELARSILEDLRPRAYEAARKSTDGTYHTVPFAQPGDTLLVRLLLVDQLHSLAVERLVQAGEQTPEHTKLLRYFTPADIAFMQQQLPSAHAFRFEQANLRHPWVKVLPLDTLRTLYGRITRQFGDFSEPKFGPALAQHHGSTKSFAIGGMLFSKDRHKALAAVAYDDGMEINIYGKTGAVWRWEGRVYWMMR
jgi:hypothetical protein